MQAHRTRRPRVPPSALAIIDMINTWEIADGDALLRQSARIVAALARLKARAQAAQVPVIYVNDNFGQWRSDFKQVIAAARETNLRAAQIVDALVPGDDDYFVLKPKHSAFFGTPLELLLEKLRVERLILCGVAGDQCVLASASDALLRGYEAVVPNDTIACRSAARTRAVLMHFRDAMDIATPPSRSVRLR
jgi:nicotinamidase-related amidase